MVGWVFTYSLMLDREAGINSATRDYLGKVRCEGYISTMLPPRQLILRW